MKKPNQLPTPNEFDLLLKSGDLDKAFEFYKKVYGRVRGLGRPMGRPPGGKNRTHKLDAHKEEIERYLNIGVSSISICRIIGCSPQVLKRYVG